MTEQTKIDLLITNAAQVLTCVPANGDSIGRIENGAVAVAGERIVAVGWMPEVLSNVDASSAKIINAAGKIVVPGFVDSHTHLIFGGSRVREYALRMTRGRDEVKRILRREEIETGIPASVEMTRAASVETLTASAVERLRGMLAHGTTTVESKSGYGLSLDEEIKMLEVNRQLQALRLVDVVSTFLGAHDFPSNVNKEYQTSRDRYLDVVVNEMIPQVARQGLAEFCDVFCDTGYFTTDEARRILESACNAGLKLKIHADEYEDIGASDLAAELGAVSADHLNYTKSATLHKLKEAGVVGVVMPALDFAVHHSHPFDVRTMLDEGLTVALATDFCPACWVESMQLVMQLACRLYQFSPEEALYAATVGGAKALGLDDRGVLAADKLADIQIWNIPTFEDIVYRLGNNAVETVIKRGRVVIPSLPGR